MVMQNRRTTSATAPSGLQPGQFSVNMVGSRPQVWAGVPTSVDASGRLLVVDPQLLGGRAISSTAPTDGQVYAWNAGASEWRPTAQTGGGGLTAPTGPVVSSNGTALGSLTLGTNLSVTGTFPNQTLNATGGGGLTAPTGPLVSSNGAVLGSLAIGANLSVTGTFPNQTLAATGGGGLTAPTGPLVSSNGTALGSLAIGANLTVTGTFPNQTLAAGGGGAGLPDTGGTMTGALEVNTSGAGLPSAPVGTVVQLMSNGGAPTNEFTIMTMDAASGVALSRLQLRRAGGAPGALANIGTNAQIGFLDWFGYFNGAWTGGGNIHCITSAAAWAAGSAPTRMNFQTARGGESLPTTKMYIGVNGGFVVGNPGGLDTVGQVRSQSAYVSGDLEVDGDIVIGGISLKAHLGL